MEHVWDYLYRRVKSGNVMPSNLQDLQGLLTVGWDNLDENYLKTLTGSLQQRCRDVIRARDGNTVY